MDALIWRRVGTDRKLVVESFGALLLGPWAMLQHAHTMVASAAAVWHDRPAAAKE